MSAVIDFHSHVLPGIDDGSRNVAESIAMLRAEAAQGIACVVATPHFYAQHDSPEHFLESRAEAAKRLQAEMAKYDGLPELLLGAEVYFFPGIAQSDALTALTIEGKTSILIEMPSPPWSENMYRELEEIWTRRGLVPIVAHVDRYIRPFRTYHIPQRLAQLPVLVQANASFFLHRSTGSMAEKMLRKGQIHLLGSDCHNMTTRVPNLGPAIDQIRKHCGEMYIEQIASCQEDALLDR